MTLFDVMGWAALSALAWLWYDSSRARETAVAAARDACADKDLQFLDETVSIAKLWPTRDADGRLVLRRVYRFEYSCAGDDRLRGNVVVIGANVAAVYVGLHLVPSVK